MEPATGPDPFCSVDLHPKWMGAAECKGQDHHLFFDGGKAGEARSICARCTVREPCLAFALADTELQGLWGGKSEPERRRMRRDATKPSQEETGASSTPFPLARTGRLTRTGAANSRLPRY